MARFQSHPTTLEETLFTGGYPRILDRELNPSDWLRSYVATYIERDVRALSAVGDLSTFQRFVELCAGRTGQLLNFSSLADDCGVSQPTARRWLSILEASFIVFRMSPFHSNLRKRLIRMPKLHFYDSGLVCWLLGIRDPEQLRTHPLRGQIFESWVASEIIKRQMNQGEPGSLSFYRDRDGVEVDFIIERPSGLTLIEAKSTQTPSGSLLSGIRRVRRYFEGSRPIQGVVVYGGNEVQSRSEASLIPWNRLHETHF